MLQLLPDRPALCTDSATDLHLLVRITPNPPQNETRRPEINLSLVLDRSGSMNGAKMDMTRQAAAMAVHALREEDRLSVVVFDHEVQTLVPCGPPRDKNQITHVLSQIEARGQTALCDGWRQGINQASLARDSRRINRIVLLTDGQANQGETNADIICTEVRRFANQGLQTTTLGFGSGYNDELLRSMAASGDGNHFFVETPEQLTDYLELELGGLAATRGTRVRLAIEPLVPGVSAEPVAPMDRDAEGQLMLGDMIAHCPLEILLAVRIPAASQATPVLRVHLTYHCTETASEEKRVLELELPGLSRAQWLELEENAEVRLQLTRAQLAVLRTEAMTLLRDGRESQAMLKLRECLRLPALPALDRSTLNDLIETLERRDHSSTFKKAAMHGHGHSKGHGHYGLQARNSSDGLHILMRRKEIALAEGPLLSSHPAPRTQAWGRVQGMLRGLAHGEALGLLQNEPGEATALTVATLSQLAGWGGFNASRLAAELSRAPVARVSPSLEAFRRQLARGEEWHECGAPSAGCGALRRIPAVLVGRLEDPDGLWADVAMAGMLTHNDNASLTACLGFTALLWDLLEMPAPPEPSWYLTRFLEAVEGLETGQTYSLQARRFDGWKGTLSTFVRERIEEARERDLTAEQAMREWGSGPYVFEMVPGLLYILEQHAEQPRAALEAATRTTFEPGSLGALVGAALGALHGDGPHWTKQDDLEQMLLEVARTFGYREG